MTSTVRYLGELRTEAIHQLSGNQIITDAPPDNQGKGEAFSPTDLVATALASCMITIMGIKARDHGWAIEGTQAEITKMMASNPRRISGVTIVMHIPDRGLEDHAKEILKRSALTCPVALSLHPDLAQEVTFLFEKS